MEEKSRQKVSIRGMSEVRQRTDCIHENSI